MMFNLSLLKNARSVYARRILSNGIKTSAGAAIAPIKRLLQQSRQRFSAVDGRAYRAEMTKTKCPVRCVLFDLDGLLLDTVPIYELIMEELVISLGYKFTDRLRRQVLGRSRVDCARLIVEHCQFAMTLEECLLELSRHHAEVLPHCKMMPGAERLVRHFFDHGVPMAIATSSSAQSVRLKLRNHGKVVRLMSHVITADDPRVFHGKPSPDVFLVAAESFDTPVSPEECLVFEDAPNGVKAAVAAGMQVVLVSRSCDHDNKEATMIVDSLLNFRPEVFGLPPFEGKV